MQTLATSSIQRVRWSILAAFVLTGVIGGCQPTHPENLPRLFVPASNCDPSSTQMIDPNSKYATYRQELSGYMEEMPTMDHKDYAMIAANRAMIHDALGQVGPACQNVLDAQAIMTGEVKGEKSKAAAASVGDEASKTFKGECYEISMINALVGMYNLKMGDSETAAIGFRRALEADKMSKEECRDDFNLAYWGLAMAEIDSDPDTARQMLKRCGYKSADIVAGENLIFMIYLGRAPWKQLVGLYGEHDVIRPSDYEPKSAEIFIDGVSVGKSFKLIDLHEQSGGVPRSGKDAGQAAKAVGKFALAVTASVFLGDLGQDIVESAWAINSDSRTCFMLPNEVHVISTTVPPGPSTVRVKFYDGDGGELKRYEQVWRGVRAPRNGRRFLTLRSEFDRCNVQGPVAFTRVSKVKTITKKTPAVEGQPAKTTDLTTINFRSVNLPNVKVGDTIKVCHFYSLTQNRMDTNYHWRYQPLAYNTKGEPVGHPGNKLRLQDYDVGLVGLATVTSVEGETASAEMTSLTTEYKPRPDDMVTATKRVGRVWR